MIEIRPAKTEELPQIKELFKRCFGDSDVFIDMLYQKYCKPEQVLVVMEDGELNSMLSVLDTTFTLPGGESFPVGYIYALATNPYIQSQGHARQLMAAADEYLKERGFKCLSLVPASPSLHRYFENLGLSECFSSRKVEIMSAALEGLPSLGEGCRLTPILPQEYNEIRKKQLGDTPSIHYPDELIQLQQFCSHLSAGDLYKIEVDGEVGCAAIEYVQRSRLLTKELLISQKSLDKAVQLIFENLPAARYHVRTPGFGEGMKGSYIQAFGMVKWYDKDLQQKFFNLRQDAYLGLAFD